MPLIVRDYLERGPATSKEIQAGTGLSQTAVARQIRKIGGSVIKLPSGRSPRYALTRNAFGVDDNIPLTMVDAHGNTVVAARIRPLAHGGFFVEPETGTPGVLLGTNKDGLFDDLPYFLSDLSPQGFLGRQIAEELAAQSDDFPQDPGNWNTNHIGRYLVSNGDDLSGNFKFGQQALSRVRRKPIVVTVNDYPELADSVMSGVVPGSSAGGEHPKFTAFCGERSAHVIVKFSPKGNNEIARRWRDILITEYHAAEAIHNVDFPAAETRILEFEDRIFLESIRFDRSGEYGRMSMLSLQAVDAEFAGLGSNWPKVMSALHEEKLVSWAHVYDTEYLWNFGRLIYNTDMHLGNLSLGIEGNVFRLLPVYDMCSMGFAPKSGGEIQPYDFDPPEPISLNLGAKTIADTIEMAKDFWNRVAGDNRISDDFKRFLDRGNPIDRLP